MTTFTRFFYFLVFYLALPALLSAQEAGTVWYRSNPAGMALERLPSRLMALRNRYGLSIAPASPRDLPSMLRSYYDSSWEIELRILYEEGKESRRQWIFLDENRRGRMNASGASGLFEPPSPSSSTGESGAAGAAPTGFIELYDGEGFITEEHRFAEDGKEYISLYTYKGSVLVRAENRERSPPEETEGAEKAVRSRGPVKTISSDFYRYSRSGSLRAVDRIYHEAVSAEERLVRIGLPRLGMGVPPLEDRFVEPDSASQNSEFFSDLSTEENTQVTYITDERGRVLREEWKDEEGNVYGVFHNTWTEDRLSSIVWKSGEDERRTEYEYNSQGDRIVERNIKNGILERLVRLVDGREIEEIFVNGGLALRAIWEGGRKISEERIYDSEQRTGAR